MRVEVSEKEKKKKKWWSIKGTQLQHFAPTWLKASIHCSALQLYGNKN